MAKLINSWKNEYTGQVFETLGDCLKDEEKYRAECDGKEHKDTDDALISVKEAHTIAAMLEDYQEYVDWKLFIRLLEAYSIITLNGQQYVLVKEEDMRALARASKQDFLSKYGEEVFDTLVSME